ncbi:MAG: histidine kinase [Saprospiraceae bacterium]|nr:histidine kinase [Saprospiraceae bacterium]
MTNKIKKIILTHTLIWLTGWLLIAWMIVDEEYFWGSLLKSFLFSSGYAVLFYTNAFVLFPKLWNRKRYFLHILAVSTMICTNGIIFSVFMPPKPLPTHPYYSNAPLPHAKHIPNHNPVGPGHLPNPINHHTPGGKIPQPPPQDTILGLPTPALRQFFAVVGFSIVVCFISTLFQTAQETQKREKKELQLEREKLETEMRFLKSQINPHFLFNVLNNIYTLSYIGSEVAPQMILKLSNMLRYMLYEAHISRVPLAKEVVYLSDYIEMQLLKDDELNVQYDFDNINPQLPVAPMLFISFVENSFKHSKIEDLDNGWINLKLYTIDQTIHFEIHNSIPQQVFTKDHVGGIGLVNVRKQLDLLYPNNYHLDMKTSDQQFSVFLKIELPKIGQMTTA